MRQGHRRAHHCGRDRQRFMRAGARGAMGDRRVRGFRRHRRLSPDDRRPVVSCRHSLLENGNRSTPLPAVPAKKPTRHVVRRQLPPDWVVVLNAYATARSRDSTTLIAVTSRCPIPTPRENCRLVLPRTPRPPVCPPALRPRDRFWSGFPEAMATMSGVNPISTWPALILRCTSDGKL